MLHSSILREYDIRGIVGKTLFPDDAFWIGKAFAHIAKERSKVANPYLVVGWDGRLTSPILKEYLLKGLSESGVTVFTIGLGPTPLISYGNYALNAHGSIMITGSHNPADFNGFKMTLLGLPFFAEDILHLSHIIPQLSRNPIPGSIISKNLHTSYIDRLTKDLHFQKPLKVVWDSGNSACGEILQKLLPTLPGEHFLLNADIDGNFPNHHPDPTVPENLTQLQEKVLEVKADFGCAFDGDGDRLGIVDGKGRILWGDQIMVLFTQSILKKLPGSSIIADVKASDTLFEYIAQEGGKPVMCRTGHSIIKTKMKELNAPLAGEMSGHLFFADKYYGYDDAIYAALRFLEILSCSPFSLVEFYDQLPKTFSTPEIRLNIEDPSLSKTKIIESIKEKLKSQNIPFNDLDGIRLKTPNGWWGIRAANTQEALSIRCEGKTPETLISLCKEVNNYLAPFELKISKFS